MACDWEIALYHADARYAEQAAGAAFAEVDRLEQELSRFIATSDIAQLNRLQPGQVLRLGADAVACLALARELHDATGGAFDPTIGALLPNAARSADSTAGSAGSAAREPQDPVRQAPGRVSSLGASGLDTQTPLRSWGMKSLQLDAAERTVRVAQAGLIVDLGALGKGYAVDRAVEVLREWGIAAARVHSGQSTVFCLGAPPGEPGWTVSVRNPGDHARTLGKLVLRDAAFSGSGVALHGAHIIDPRTGDPAEHRRGAWALAPTAALSDAVSTAFMVMSDEEIAAFCTYRPEVRALCATYDPHCPLWSMGELPWTADSRAKAHQGPGNPAIPEPPPSEGRWLTLREMECPGRFGEREYRLWRFAGILGSVAIIAAAFSVRWSVIVSLVVAALALGIQVYLFVRWRDVVKAKFREYGAGFCLGCGYPRFGLADDQVCPECGRAFNRAQNEWIIRERWRYEFALQGRTFADSSSIRWNSSAASQNESNRRAN